MKVKEITISKKMTINLGDYSNEVIELTLTAESDEEYLTDFEITHLDSLLSESLVSMVSQAVENRLIAGIPALNGKQGALRRQALEAQPCVKVLATLDPDTAKEVVDKVLELSLAPERKAETMNEKFTNLTSGRLIHLETTEDKEF